LYIKNEQMPLGVRRYIDFLIENIGEFKIEEESIIKSREEDGLLVECKLYQDDTEMAWFSNEGILYIFINGKNTCYYEHGELIFV